MTIKMNERKTEKIFILFVSGEMVNENDGNSLKLRVMSLIKKGKKVIIDFSGLTSILTDGLNGLFGIKDEKGKPGVGFKISGMSDKMKTILTTTKMISFFDYYETYRDAINSFQKEGGVK